jgi:hypothetical protein
LHFIVPLCFSTAGFIIPRSRGTLLKHLCGGVMNKRREKKGEITAQYFKRIVIGNEKTLEDVAALMNKAGAKIPKKGLPITKNKVAQYTSKTSPPAWFLDFAVQVLDFSQVAPESSEEDLDFEQKPRNTSKETPLKTRYTDVYLLRSLKEKGLRDDLAALSTWTKRVRVPGWIEDERVIAVPIDRDIEPIGVPGDVVLMVPNANVKQGKVYAVTLPDGSGTYCKAVRHQGRTFLRDLEGRMYDFQVEGEVYVDAKLVGYLPQYVPSRNRGTFDDDGLEYSEWP